MLALFWLTALPLTFISPAAGVAFWIWDALLSPTEFVYSFMASVPTNKLAALATLFGLVSNPKSRDIYFDFTGALLVLLSVSVTISWATAITSWDVDTTLYLKIIKEIVLAFAVMYLVHSQRWIHVCVLVIGISISFLGVKEGLISLLTVGGHKIIGSRAIGDNNQLAAALLVTIPILVFAYKQIEQKIIRWGLAGAIVLDIVTVIMTFSRGGFIGLVCLGGLYVTGSKRKLQTVLLLSIIGIALYAVAPQAWFARVDTINDAYDDSSFMGRVIAWKISWLIATDNPLFGGGMHAVQHGPVWFRYSFQLPELDWIIATPVPDVLPHAAHSIVFEVLGDLGFVGLGIYTLLFGTAYSNLKKVSKIARGREDLQWASDLAHSMRFSLLIYLLTGLLLSVGYFELLFVLWALSSRCLRTVRQMSAVTVEIIDDPRGPQLLNAIRPKRAFEDALAAPRRRYRL